MDPSRRGVVEEDEDVDCDESGESTGVRSNVTARLVTRIPAAVPWGRAAPAGGRGTAAATSLRGAAMEEILGSPVHSSAGTSWNFAMSTPPATSFGVNASGGTASPGVSVESPSVSEEDEADDYPSPKFGGSTARELRRFGETSVVRQGRARGEKRRNDLDLAALFAEATLAIDPGMVVDVRHASLSYRNYPLRPGAVNDTEIWLQVRWNLYQVCGRTCCI